MRAVIAFAERIMCVLCPEQELGGGERRGCWGPGGGGGGGGEAGGTVGCMHFFFWGGRSKQARLLLSPVPHPTHGPSFPATLSPPYRDDSVVDEMKYVLEFPSGSEG